LNDSHENQHRANDDVKLDPVVGIEMVAAWVWQRQLVVGVG
jgi:hypothetical protein